MKEKIVNNIGLKILSFVLAVILWVTIINVIDPSDDKIISGIQVELLNQDTLTSQGYTYEILDGNTVSISVNGPKSKISGLTSQDFYASADFSTISPLSDYVDINVKCTKSGISTSDLTITLRNSAVRLNIENRESRVMDVKLDITGEPADGYVTGDYDVSPMSVKITGAESVVESINSVIAECNVVGASMDVSETVTLKLYDEDGTEIDKSGLVLSREDVKVNIPILVKKKVPVNYAYMGTVKEGYKIASINPSIKEVEIAGNADTIAAIDAIDVPAELINVDDLTGIVYYSIRLSHYVPSNVKLLSSTVTSEVVVNIEELVKKEINVPSKNIVIENASDAYNYSFTRDTVAVTVSGLKDDVEDLNALDIKGSVDVTGIAPGNRIVKVDFDAIDNCSVAGEYTVTINITRK